MVRRTKEEAEQTRDQILDAAENLFYEHGVAHTSLEQIARAAGVTRGAVYWHFRNKIDLFEAMQQRTRLPQEDVLEELAENGSDDPLEALRDSCKGALVTIARDDQRRRVCCILLHRCEYVEEMGEPEIRQLRNKEHMIALLIRIFETAQKLGTLAPHWTPLTAALGLHGLMHGLISDWVNGSIPHDLAEYGPPCVDGFFEALIARPAKVA
ncbi:TetR family transcriptional regulator [Oceanibaculum nanhaiense]|uniref:TetR family transcriptional regulator n=1 Tax=Oceanibaculum nanhaiense TaxID=1909734 RepID=UPI00396DA19D